MRTRKQAEACAEADKLPTDEKQSAIDETEDTLATPLIKGPLSKFQYKTTASSSKDVTTPSPTTTTRSSKRTRSTVADLSTFQPSKKKKPSGYAPPAKYAHLSPLVDILEPNLICVFVGTNPGVQTATAGHAYAHPSNLFWRLLHSSGLTDRRLRPDEDRSLPALYCMGNTNIVSRPSKDAAELSKEEMAAGTADLDAKFLKYKPEAVCIVGKGIWEAIWRYRYGRNPKKTEFKYGWQDQEHNMGKGTWGKEVLGYNGKVWRGTRVFVATSTSGLAASLTQAEKEAIWRPFGEWVQKRREERDFKPVVEEVVAETE